MMPLSYLAAALLVLGILAGVRAVVLIRANMDLDLEDLHRQARWAAIAVVLVGAGCLLELALKHLT